MMKRTRENCTTHDEDEERSSKTRRIARACMNCRTRKQRCLTTLANADLRTSCRRCTELSIECSFMTETSPDPVIIRQNLRLEDLVFDLQEKVNAHERRLFELESFRRDIQVEGSLQPLTGGHHEHIDKPESTCVITPNAHPPRQASDAGVSGVPQSMQIDVAMRDQRLVNSNVDKLELISPFATLRSMQALSTNNTASPSGRITAGQSPQHKFDPIRNGAMTVGETAAATRSFFDHYHPYAPFLQETLRDDPRTMRDSFPISFLAICSISGRLWSNVGTHENVEWLPHPNLSQLNDLLDLAISRLLIRPRPYDVCLDSVQALLLYAQWMPIDTVTSNPPVASVEPSERVPQGRYNDVSAWAAIGLAARYALALKLHQGMKELSITSQLGDNGSITSDQIAQFRTLCNLSTCDFNLMLSSGLPVSISPGNIANGTLDFSVQTNAQQPGDLRYTALIELVNLTYRALKSSGDLSGRKISPSALAALNDDFNRWEKQWTSLLRWTTAQHTYLPFTSIRWYRLALNSASINRPSKATSQSHMLPIERFQPLHISLTAAAQIILSFSESAARFIWDVDSQDPFTFPDGPYFVDSGALKRLLCAIDSAWISFTFAVTFLSFCYFKHMIDDNLQINTMPDRLVASPPQKPRLESILARILLLALGIIHAASQASRLCPSRYFTDIVQTAVSLIGVSNVQTNNEPGLEQVPVDAFLDLLHDSGLDWPASVFDFDSSDTTGLAI